MKRIIAIPRKNALKGKLKERKSPRKVIEIKLLSSFDDVSIL